MTAPNRSYGEYSTGNLTMGSNFSSYYPRPTVLLPRHSLRLHLDPNSMSQSFIGAPNQTHLYTPNNFNGEGSRAYTSRMKSSVTFEQPAMTERTDINRNTTSRQYYVYDSTPKNVLKSSMKTQRSEATDISRNERMMSSEVETKLLRENDQLKEENRLLREEVEYLRQKFTSALIRKYRPGCKELFD